MLLGVSAVLASGGCGGTGRSTGGAQEARDAWSRGEIERAAALSSAAPELAFLTDGVSGRYGRALAQYRTLPPDLARDPELARWAYEIHMRMGQYAQAEALAAEHRMKDFFRIPPARLKGRPLSVSLQDVAVIPFEDDALTPYMAGFRATLDGHEVVARLDTGGTFIAMTERSVRKVGLQTEPLGPEAVFRGKPMRFGLVRELRLGAAVLRNVPVLVLAAIEGDLDLLGDRDHVVLGTNILEQFLSTLDYPGKRMILSPRGNGALAERHLRMLPKPDAEVPFWMAMDHFLFTRGGIGTHTGLNFFIDTGLLEFTGEGKDRKQFAVATSPELLKEWGYPEPVPPHGLLQEGDDLAIGPLRQSGHVFQRRGGYGKPMRSFGGIRIDGLVGHAFLCRYCWTLDFDRRVFLLGEPEPIRP